MLALTVNLIRDDKDQPAAVFLAFCYALWLFCDLYWVIYDLTRPDVRMPFAANEFGEAATLLMAAATVSSAAGLSVRRIRFITVGALIFSCLNVALWIAWNGEWVQDIFFGAAFAWFLCTVADALYENNALAIRDWVVLGVICGAVLICQLLTFIVGAGADAGSDGALGAGLGSNSGLNAGYVAELAAYIAMAAGAAFLIWRFVVARRRLTAPGVLLALAFAMVSWCTTSKYMSGGNWYTLFLLLEALGLPLWYVTVRKVVKQS